MPSPGRHSGHTGEAGLAEDTVLWALRRAPGPITGHLAALDVRVAGDPSQSQGVPLAGQAITK